MGAHLSIHLIEHVYKVVVVTLNIESIFDIKELAIFLRRKESYFLGGASDVLSVLWKEPSLDSRSYHSFESLCSFEDHPVSYIINFSKKSSDGVNAEDNNLCVLWNCNVIRKDVVLPGLISNDIELRSRLQEHLLICIAS